MPPYLRRQASDRAIPKFPPFPTDERSLSFQALPRIHRRHRYRSKIRNRDSRAISGSNCTDRAAHAFKTWGRRSPDGIRALFATVPSSDERERDCSDRVSCHGLARSRAKKQKKKASKPSAIRFRADRRCSEPAAPARSPTNSTIADVFALLSHFGFASKPLIVAGDRSKASFRSEIPGEDVSDRILLFTCGFFSGYTPCFCFCFPPSSSSLFLNPRSSRSDRKRWPCRQLHF